MAPPDWGVLSRRPHTFLNHGPQTCDRGRQERHCCSRGGGVCHIALEETQGDASPWNKASHPQRWWHGGSHSCSSENTTMKTLLPQMYRFGKTIIESGIKQTAVKKKGKWGGSVMILYRRSPQKTWATLPTFYQLLIQLCPLNSLGVKEFWRSNFATEFCSRQSSGWTELNFWASG
jgi:hypothetical protein